MPDDHENASLLSLDDATRKNVTTWLSQDYDVATKEEIRRLLKNSPRELTDAFYTTLEFGTGGLRGLTGVGCNRMNRYTVQYATQGLANYLKSQFKKASEPLKVAISFDSRLSSNEFAEETAKVLAGNGIQVFLFKELRPTPVLSFACRHKKCHAAIMVTASHNPSNYNGYKVYWNDGAQVVFPHDKGIIKEVQQVKAPTQVHLAPMNSPLISYLDESLDEAYLNALAALQIYPKECQKLGGALKVIYSNLHGTGITVLPKLLERFGITNLSFVEEQKKPDGSFPTVKSPNPEEREALQLGIKQMEREKADLLIATDPDADRVAAVVMHDGQPAIIDGNQMACLLLEHVLEGLSSKGKLPKNGAAVKSLVTSELFGRIAAAYQVPCLNVLTGFKYIAEKIREWEQTGAHQFLFGGEESYGYLFGTNSRDKDAIISATLIAEMAALAKAKGQTLVDRLHELYKKYGIYKERLISLNFPETQQGRAQMQSAMQSLRSKPPKNIGHHRIFVSQDLLSGQSTNHEKKETSPIDLPPSDVLVFLTEEGYKIVIRPSGTEPKVKVYLGVSNLHSLYLEQGMLQCQQKLDELQAEMRALFQS